MAAALDSITIRGFRSIERLDEFKLERLNVLIGANGSGKSNLVDFFRMLRAMTDERLQKFINEQGGADGFFYLGPRHTRQISASLQFGRNAYEFDLEPVAGSGLQIADERVQYLGGRGLGQLHSLGKGNSESLLKTRSSDQARLGTGRGVPSYVYDSVSHWTVYHFHDTSMYAPMRREQSARDTGRLRPDASNLAAVLLDLRTNNYGRYEQIRDTVRLTAPFLDDFILDVEEKANEPRIRLEWRHKGSDFPFQAIHLSDGTMRFICLATALLQLQVPITVLFDEPELGLHPYAIHVLSELIQAVVADRYVQVIVSTQSPILLDRFEPEQIVVVSRREGASEFRRLDRGDLDAWLDEYSVGELWQKNIVQAGPTSD